MVVLHPASQKLGWQLISKGYAENDEIMGNPYKSSVEADGHKPTASEMGPYRVPTTTALVVFEAAARHGNFTQAAMELGISQPAISRTIGNLEQRLSLRLFERARTGVTLTDAGRRFLGAVTAGLGIIHAASVEAATRLTTEQVTIACSPDTSHLFVLPKFPALQETLGDNVEIRIHTFQFEMWQLPRHPPVDVVLTWDAAAGTEEFAVIHEDAVTLICSPDYAANNAQTLKKSTRFWGGLTFLDLVGSHRGGASWDDWFRVVERPEVAPRFKYLDLYTYVLQAALAGQGIALGRRHYIERYLKTGQLLQVNDDFVEFNNKLYGVVTEHGRDRSLARKCLSFFEQRT